MHVHCPPPPGTVLTFNTYNTFVPLHIQAYMHVHCPPPPGTVLTFNTYNTFVPLHILYDIVKGWEILMETIKTTKYFKVKVLGAIKDNLMCFSCYNNSYELSNKHLDGIIQCFPPVYHLLVNISYHIKMN